MSVRQYRALFLPLADSRVVLFASTDFLRGLVPCLAPNDAYILEHFRLSRIENNVLSIEVKSELRSTHWTLADRKIIGVGDQHVISTSR